MLSVGGHLGCIYEEHKSLCVTPKYAVGLLMWGIGILRRILLFLHFVTSLKSHGVNLELKNASLQCNLLILKLTSFIWLYSWVWMVMHLVENEKKRKKIEVHCTKIKKKLWGFSVSSSWKIAEASDWIEVKVKIISSVTCRMLFGPIYYLNI